MPNFRPTMHNGTDVYTSALFLAELVKILIRPSADVPSSDTFVVQTGIYVRDVLS